MPCFETIKKKAPQLLEQMTAEEKLPDNEYELHDLTHQVMRELFPKERDIHAKLAKMSSADLKMVWQIVIMRYRQRRAKKLSAARYLRQEGRTKQAEQLEKEVELEDAQTAKQEQTEVTAQQ